MYVTMTQISSETEGARQGTEDLNGGGWGWGGEGGEGGEKETGVTGRVWDL